MVEKCSNRKNVVPIEFPLSYIHSLFVLEYPTASPKLKKLFLFTINTSLNNKHIYFLNLNILS